MQITTFGQTIGQISETISHAAFSPSGTTIIYDSQSTSGNLLVLAGADGTNPQVLLTAAAQTGGTQPSGTLALPRAPEFSADGSTIVFVYNPAGTDQIYTMSATGTNVTPLTTSISGTNVDNPAYTKGGNIRFITTNSSGVLQYNLITTSGSAIMTTTTFSPSVAGRSNYSPDGTKIVYTAAANSKSDVFLMNSDGSNPTQLTKLGAATIGKVRFSNDNAKVIFDVAMTSTSMRTLYQVNVDGTGLQPISVASSNSNNYFQDAH